MPSNEENNIPKSEPRVMGGPRRGRNMPAEKAKDFNSAIKRLTKELRSYKFVMIFALILAVMGAILTIAAPKQLTKLTDEISKGLIVNKDNIQAISDGVTNNLKDEETQKKITDIIGLSFSQKDIDEILKSDKVSDEDKETYFMALEVFDHTDKIEGFVQFLKVSLPMLFIVFGLVILVKFVHSSNVLSGIVVIDVVLNTALSRFLQRANTPFPIDVTVLGIITSPLVPEQA